MLLRLGFDRAEIVRLLDETPISTETDTPNIGLVRDQLAYEVTGSAFWAQQSDALNLILLGLRHYRFITGWTCLDVLSLADPTFTLVTEPAGQAKAQALYRTLTAVKLVELFRERRNQPV
ncbi:MAG: hypothetical protein ACR650_12420 [Methylocystis sp.]